MRGRNFLLVVVISLAVASGCGPVKGTQIDPKPDEVLVSNPTIDEVTDFEDFIGHTDAMYSVEVRARVNGYLDKVNFNDGDEVEKGTLLFQIDPRQYQATFDQTLAALEQGQARLTRTTADHRRAEALLKRNAIGQEEYDRIQGDYGETKASIGSAKAALDMAQLNLDWTKVTAPISGRLSRRMVDPGNLVRADDTLLTTIVSLDPMYVNFDIDERTMLKLRRLIAGGKIPSRAEGEIPILVGLSDETDYPHRGLINFSDNKLDSSTGTLRLRAVISNPKPDARKPRLLSPGLFVRVRLPVGKPHRSILISEEAIGTDQGNKFVYVVEKGTVKKKDKKTGKVIDAEAQVVAYRPIKVGSLTKGLRVIESGLKMDERVIVSGLQRVRKGKEVSPRFANETGKASEVKSAPKSASTAPNAGGPEIAVIEPVVIPVSPASPTATPSK